MAAQRGAPSSVKRALLKTRNNGPPFQRNHSGLRTAARPPRDETWSVALARPAGRWAGTSLAFGLEHTPNRCGCIGALETTL